MDRIERGLVLTGIIGNDQGYGDGIHPHTGNLFFANSLYLTNGTIIVPTVQGNNSMKNFIENVVGIAGLILVVIGLTVVVSIRLNDFAAIFTG